MPPAPSNHVDNVKSYDYDIETLPDPCSTWCKLSETPRITNKVLVLHLYIVSITFLDTYPSPFLSISLNSFSIGVSSPRNSSTVSRPSKSRSKAAKKWSTLSLILNYQSVCLVVYKMYHLECLVDIDLVTGTPERCSTLNHSSLLSLPSPSRSARANSFFT